MATRIINPVLPGFYPDPSMCAANGKYYLVCSSFSYVPGLPIFESKDLVRWQQVGNIIDRPEQLDFSGQGVSRGLFAPTIRHYNGKFYCICTQVDKLGNFLVTAEKPEGPWSNPIAISGAEGIDPSLFFDEDGTCWYTGTRPAPEGPKYNGNWEIWIQRLNPETGELYGEAKGIWRGALKNCVWPEGPHIYKFFGKYYLLHAEGGTGADHAVCVARCDTIDGEWVGKPSNPILTHRHMGLSAGIINVGHADIVCTSDNKWWMCCLASRPYGEPGKRVSNMGRETFLAPVKWEDGWPVVSWETGKLENAYSYTGGVVTRANEDADAVIFPVIDDFNSPKLENYWLSLRHRKPEYINCSENSGNLRLYGGDKFTECGEVTMVARRQTGFSFEACTCIRTHFEDEGDAAGIVCFQNEKFNYRLQIISRGKMFVLQLVKIAGENAEDEVIAEDVMTGGQKEVYCVLRVVAEHQKLRFEFGPDERNMHVLIDGVDASILSTEAAGGFVGTIVGMFAVAGGDYKQRRCYADFDWFKYENTGREWICK